MLIEVIEAFFSSLFLSKFNAQLLSLCLCRCIFKILYPNRKCVFWIETICVCVQFIFISSTFDNVAVSTLKTLQIEWKHIVNIKLIIKYPWWIPDKNRVKHRIRFSSKAAWLRESLAWFLDLTKFTLNSPICNEKTTTTVVESNSSREIKWKMKRLKF